MSLRSSTGRGSAVVAGVLLSSMVSTHLPADEGMWLFNRLPLKHLREKYGFEPEPGGAENLSRAAVRIASGGSGSFVSPSGLVMTNHHVGSDTLQKLSTKTRNLL